MFMLDVSRRIDAAKWGRPHWAIFASTSIGYLMWGVIGSLAYLFYPSVNAVWFLVAPVIGQLAGDLGLSYLSDRRLGRKAAFYLTMMLYGVGSLIIVTTTALISSAPYYPYLVAFGIVLAEIGVEGEVPVSLSYQAETMPLREREKILVLTPNFDNVGAALAALVGFVVYGAVGSHYVELQVLGYFAFALTLIAFVIRYLVPESARWLAHSGRVEEAKKIVSGLEASEQGASKPLNKSSSLTGRFLFLLLIGVSQYLTYGLMAYVVADYYFSGNTVNFVVLVANLAAAITGFIIPLFITKVSMRKYGFGVFVGGALSMLPILYTLNLLGSSMALFYLFLAVNMAFSEMAWSVRTVLEPLLMPTKLRAFMVGLIRLGPILGYTASLYLTSTLSVRQFIEYNLALWVVGALATLYWLLRGYDVQGVSLEDTAGETLSLQTSVGTSEKREV